MKKHRLIFLILAVCFGLASCNLNNDDVSGELIPSTDFEKEESDMFTDNDYDTDYDEDSAIAVSLNGDSISCTSVKASVNGTTITLTSGATYIFSGKLDNGSIIVDAKDTKPHIIFNNVDITNNNFASLYVKEADKVFITLIDGTTNSLSNVNGFIQIDDNNVDGVIFSKQDLTINGSGAISISSPYGNGIVCKDDLVLAGGSYTIDAANHGLDANDSIRICDVVATIEAGKDGIHAENSDDEALGYIYIASGEFDITAADDGISSNLTIEIEAGTFNIYTGPAYTTLNTSLKGIKATSSILISDGAYTINSFDDSIHSNSSVVINGGTLNISTSDDGIHADEILQIANGTINITKSYEGLEALTINVSGGNISMVCSDDGLNAAGGNDSSGVTNSGMPTRPGGGHGRPGDNFGGGGASSGNGYIKISGGYLYIQASGDGIDANGSLSITGGVVYVCGPTNGDTAVLDYDKTGTISGGEFYGSGSSMMAQTLTGSGQGVIGVSVGSQTANTAITVKNSQGEVVAELIPVLAYQIIIISNSKIISGETYTITIGSSTGTALAK